MADAGSKQLDELVERLRVMPGSKVTLAEDHDPGYTDALTTARARLESER
jgi:hypothetical protein